MKVSLHPEAERDIEAAADFYLREGSKTLAARFIREFRKATELLIEQPDMGAPRSAGRRGLRMNVFPYTLIYRVKGSEIRVLVVKHDRKRPGYGTSRT